MSSHSVKNKRTGYKNIKKNDNTTEDESIDTFTVRRMNAIIQLLELEDAFSFCTFVTLEEAIFYDSIVVTISQ